jgi:hypothetical protein
VNSDGGEVIQGSNLFNYLDRTTDVDVTWVIDGIAASMTALLLTNPRHKVIAARHAKFMYHSVWGHAAGNSVDIRAYADMIDTFEASLVDMMAARMGVEASAVKSKFFDGADHWLSAEQAKALGLCDEILVGGVALEEPVDLAGLTKRDVFNFYNKQIINKRMGKENSNIFALALGLPETEDESKVVAQLQGIVAQNKSQASALEAERKKNGELENRLRELEKGRVSSLVDTAIEARKISADEKDTYVALAEKDFEAVEKILNRMQGVATVKAQLNTKGAAAKYEGKTWDELDRTERLAGLKAEAPELYNKLYKEKFGV